MERLTIAALVLGLMLAGYLISETGLQDVGRAIAASGWAVVLVVLARILVVLFAGIAWWRLFPPDDHPSLQTCVNIRLVREAINSLLPVAQIGGDFIGARLLALKGWNGASAAASVVTDLFLQIAVQFLFTVLGLVLLVRIGTGGSVVSNVAIGLAIAAPGLVGFYLIQRRGAGRVLLEALKRLAGDRNWRAISATDAFYDSLSRFHRRYRALGESALWHFAAWAVGSFEVYAALHLMGHPVSIGEALVIESLAQAVRGAAFAVPGAVGVQEGGLIVLCGIFGVPADEAIALSLLKRVADVVIGLPGLAMWHVIEGRRLLARNAARGLRAKARRET